MDPVLLITDQRNLLSTTLNELRESNILTDVSIQCRSGNVSAHSPVLVAINSYFRTMLIEKKTDNNPLILQFDTYSKESMEVVISFLYGREIFPTLEKNEELLREVLSIAHKLEITALLNCIWDYFIRSLSPHNYTDIWCMAKKYNQIKMQENVFKFMLDNLRKLLIIGYEVEIFNEMMHEFVTFAAINHSNDSILEFILKWGEQNPKERMEDLLAMVTKVNFDKISNGYIHELQTGNKFVNTNPILKKTITEKASSRQSQRVEQIHIYCYNEITGEMSTQMFCLKTNSWYDKEVTVLSTKTAKEWHQIKFGGSEQYYFAIAKNRKFVVYDPDEGTYYFGPTAGKWDVMGVADANDLIFWDHNFKITRFNIDLKKWFAPASIAFLGYSRYHSTIISAKGKLFIDVEETDIFYTYNKNINKWRLMRKPYCNLKVIKNACDNSKSKLFFLKDDEQLLLAYDPDSDEWEELNVPMLGNLLPICMNTNQTLILCYENIKKFDLRIYNLALDKLISLPRGLQLEVIDWKESDISLK